VLGGSIGHTLTTTTAATAAMLLISPGPELAQCSRISEILITKFSPVFNDTILGGLLFDFLWPNFHGSDIYANADSHTNVRILYKPCEYTVALRKKKKETQRKTELFITDTTTLSIFVQKNSPSVQHAAQSKKLR